MTRNPASSSTRTAAVPSPQGANAAADLPTTPFRTRIRHLLRPSLIVLMLVLAGAASAWSALGHRLVGELAQRHLTPSARAEVDVLLAGEPDPTLGGVASWADTLRNTDPARFKRTVRWHYVNFPPGECQYEPQRDCPDGQCVIAAIAAQKSILGDRKQSREARRDALKFLVHLVGDVHQPMHASNRVDKGGNDFQISLRTDLQPEAYARDRYVGGVMGTNLHSVWDYYILGTHAQGNVRGKYAEQLGALPWPPRAPRSDSPAAWATESCRLIDARKLYPDGHRMDRRYLDAMRPLAEQRVRQAAYRLANLLNETLGH